jgi:hypothetical protein
MTYCPKCGQKNEDTAKYCNNCGGSLTFNENPHMKDDDCVCEGNNRNPLVPIFLGYNSHSYRSMDTLSICITKRDITPLVR